MIRVFASIFAVTAAMVIRITAVLPYYRRPHYREGLLSKQPVGPMIGHDTFSLTLAGLLVQVALSMWSLSHSKQDRWYQHLHE